MPSLGNLSVQIGADTRQLMTGTNKAENRLRNFDKTASKVIRNVGKLGVAAGAAGAAITAHLVNKTMRATKEMQELSDVANASVREFQRQAFAAKTVGIENEKLADIFKDVNDRVGDFIATGGGPMADFFENIAPKVGVTAEQFARLSGPEAMQLYVSSLEKANVSQQEMTFYMEAMASDATRLLPLLRNGGQAMQEQADRAERLGLVLSEVESEQVRRASIAMEQAGKAVDAIANTLTVELAPVIEAISNQFMDATEESRGWSNAVTTGVDAAIRTVGFLGDVINNIRNLFGIVGEAAAVGFAIIRRDAIGAAETISSGPIDAVNKLIQQWNKIPGMNVGEVEQFDFVKQLQTDLNDANRIVAEGMDSIEGKIEGALTDQTFSEGLMESVKQQREASRKAAQAAIEERDKQRVQELNIQTQQQKQETLKRKEAAEKAREKETQRRENNLERLRNYLATEREIEIANHERRMEWLQEARENELISEKEYQNRNIELQLKHERTLTKIEQQGANQRVKTKEQEEQAKQRAMQSAFSNMSTLMNTESKKMFKIGKAAAIAGAVVKGHQAAVDAWEAGMSTGGPHAPAVAAAYMAASLAKTGAEIAAIKSQSFSGAGGNAGGTGTGSATGNVNAAATGTGQGGGGESRPSQTVSINIEGGDDAMLSGRQVRSLIDQINEANEDGSRLVVS